jgi:oligoribonuclease NrnB/cAMP/cGMP phosphodiesterase (DHH superfamily)
MNCSDGTMAAAVFLRKFPEGKTFPLSHGATYADFAPVLEAAEQASDVYFLDCEIGYKQFLEKGYPVTILDHHIGVHDDLVKEAETSPNLTYVFDNEKSGASLAWSHFFPDEELPQVIRYIEDADLWRLTYGDTTIGVRTYCSKFWNKPEKMLSLLSEPIDEIEAKGKTLFDFTDATIHNSLLHIAPLSLEIGPYIVPAYNVTMFQSIVGNLFSKDTGSVVLLYTVEGDIVRVSVRSCEGQSPTALEVAIVLGGGGHKHASGAEVPTATFFSMLQIP